MTPSWIYTPSITPNLLHQFMVFFSFLKHELPRPSLKSWLLWCSRLFWATSTEFRLEMELDALGVSTHTLTNKVFIFRDTFLSASRYTRVQMEFFEISDLWIAFNDWLSNLDDWILNFSWSRYTPTSRYLAFSTWKSNLQQVAWIRLSESTELRPERLKDVAIKLKIVV